MDYNDYDFNDQNVENEEPILVPISEIANDIFADKIEDESDEIGDVTAVSIDTNNSSLNSLIEENNNSSSDSSTSLEEAQLARKERLENLKKCFNLLYTLIIVGLLFYIIYSSLDYNDKINNLKNTCTPVSPSVVKELDINSTIVQDLYRKVKTNILEDYAQPEWDDTMRLYLAYRQLNSGDFYDSNCTLFRNDSMDPYKCEVKGFTPRAFKSSSLILEWKKLFGEESVIHLDNIKLKNSCIGGFQYIPERDEFVEGTCEYNVTTSFGVTKTLKEVTTNGNTIVLKESVKYYENERQEKPDYLKNGIYVYTFRLDMNYNYVLTSKTYEDKY